MVIYHVVTIATEKKIHEDWKSLPPIAACVAIYCAALTGGVDVEIAAAFTLVLSFFQCFNRLAVVVRLVKSRLEPDNLKPKPMIYPALIGVIGILFVMMQLVDSMQ